MWLTADAGDQRRTRVLAEDVVLGQDVRHLSRGRDLDEPHLTVLDDLVGEVLPDDYVLGTFPAADDVVTPLDARGVVLVYRGLLRETKSVQKCVGLNHNNDGARGHNVCERGQQRLIII